MEESVSNVSYGSASGSYIIPEIMSEDERTQEDRVDSLNEESLVTTTQSNLSTSDESLYSDEYYTGRTNTKRKRQKGFKNNGSYTLSCEWKNCTFQSTCVDSFQLHVSYHIPQLELRPKDDDEEMYGCLWDLCDFETENTEEAQRHVNYHAHHTNLKAIGREISAQWNLPKCGFGTEFKNILPEVTEPYLCDWLDCGKKFNNLLNYRYHIANHVHNYPVTFKTERCMWRGCRRTFDLKFCLKVHMGSHTKEKACACPTCGGTFASHTKFRDHCFRSTEDTKESFSCDHCLRTFTTKSLLSNHRRLHMNKYKCRFCDMTCANPSVLSVHIRYKHLVTRPFVCLTCGYGTKTMNDLKSHMITHSSEPVNTCDVCNFSCRSKYTFKKHMIEVHETSKQPIYRCHMPNCEKEFKRGSYLSDHLMKKHLLSWPSGHTRFRYQKQIDGIYRLQTSRFESKEVTKFARQIPNKKLDFSAAFKVSKKNEPKAETVNFVIEEMDDDDSLHDEDDIITENSESQNECTNVNNIQTNVLLSIEDDQGNLLDCSTVTVEENTTSLPAGATIIAAAE